jgi:hypothetical protein
MSTHRIQPTTFLAIFHADPRCADAAQCPLSIQRLVHPLDFDHIRASTSDITHTPSAPRFDKINIDTNSNNSNSISNSSNTAEPDNATHVLFNAYTAANHTNSNSSNNASIANATASFVNTTCTPDTNDVFSYAFKVSIC